MKEKIINITAELIRIPLCPNHGSLVEGGLGRGLGGSNGKERDIGQVIPGGSDNLDLHNRD